MNPEIIQSAEIALDKLQQLATNLESRVDADPASVQPEEWLLVLNMSLTVIVTLLAAIRQADPAD